MPRKPRRNTRQTISNSATPTAPLSQISTASNTTGLTAALTKAIMATRYTGLGVIAYNLHQIGKGILRQAQEAKEKAAKKLQRQIKRKVA